MVFIHMVEVKLRALQGCDGVFARYEVSLLGQTSITHHKDPVESCGRLGKATHKI
jgi:hypothetical protein